MSSPGALMITGSSNKADLETVHIERAEATDPEEPGPKEWEIVEAKGKEEKSF